MAESEPKSILLGVSREAAEEILRDPDQAVRRWIRISAHIEDVAVIATITSRLKASAYSLSEDSFLLTRRYSQSPTMDPLPTSMLFEGQTEVLYIEFPIGNLEWDVDPMKGIIRDRQGRTGHYGATSNGLLDALKLKDNSGLVTAVKRANQERFEYYRSTYERPIKSADAKKGTFYVRSCALLETSARMVNYDWELFDKIVPERVMKHVARKSFRSRGAREAEKEFRPLRVRVDEFSIWKHLALI